MYVITGFAPTGQVLDHPCRAKGCAEQCSRQRPRSAGRAVAGVILLLLGFCLLIGGETIFTVQLASMDGQLQGDLRDQPLATVAALVGHGSAEAVQQLWNQGIRRSSIQQGIDEIAEDNGRSTIEVSAVLTPQEQRQSMPGD